MASNLLFFSFVSSIIALLIGMACIFFIRKKTVEQAKQQQPAGFWVRAICLGVDVTITDILTLFLAFHGSFRVAGYISMVITFSYFFFFWLFFCATPAQMFARIRVIANHEGPLKVWQVLARLGMVLLLSVGWITMLFDKEKRSLNDMVAKTRVIYAGGLVKPKANVTKMLLCVFAVILLISLAVFGSGEKVKQWSQSNQATFFDLNKDGVPDGFAIDSNQDGKPDIFKYDLNNDGVVDFSTFDTDYNGVAESVDINNDGRIDGFDFNNDNKLDNKVFSGQIIIWLWGTWFRSLAVGLTGLLIFIVFNERKKELLEIRN